VPLAVWMRDEQTGLLMQRQPAGRLGNGAMSGKKIGSRATAMPSKPGMLDGANWYQG